MTVNLRFRFRTRPAEFCAGSKEQKAREVKVLKALEENRAAQRRTATQNNEAAKSVVENFPPQTDTGKSRDIAAEKVGWSGKTAEKAIKVVDAIDRLKETDPKKAEAFKNAQGLVNGVQNQKNNKNKGYEK